MGLYTNTLIAIFLTFLGISSNAQIPGFIGRTVSEPAFPAIFKWVTLVETGSGEPNSWGCTVSHWMPQLNETVRFESGEEANVIEVFPIQGWDLAFVKLDKDLNTEPAKVFWEQFTGTHTVWGVGTDHEPWNANEYYEAEAHFATWPNWAPTVMFHCPTYGRIWGGDSGSGVFLEDQYLGPVNLAFEDDDGVAIFPEFQCDTGIVERGGGATPIGTIYLNFPQVLPVWEQQSPVVYEENGFIEVRSPDPSNGWKLQTTGDLITWVDLPSKNASFPKADRQFFRLARE